MKNEVITVELDTVIKHRSQREFRPINRARSGGLEVIGDGRIIRKILKKRHAQGASIDAVVEVRRGEALCFKPKPLKWWLERR